MKFRSLGPLTFLFALTSFAVAAPACSSKSDGGAQPVSDAGTETPTYPPLGPDCDPLVPSHCSLPFPSDFSAVDDATSKTGKRVAFKAGFLPLHNGQPTDPAAFNDADGFSAGGNLVTDLPGATATGLPTQDDIDTSLGKDSKTIVIAYKTGERVPHFSEIDVSPKNDNGEPIMIRPVVRLADATRYIVAIRKVVDDKGNVLPPSPAFVALRDGTKFDHPSIEARRAKYKEIFDALEKAGIPKGELQIAWDFTTASRENNTASLLKMRDDALSIVGADGPEYTIDSVEENPNKHIRRRLHVSMTVPIYLDKPGPGGKLVRGPDGLPKQNGTAKYEVLVHIPNSATKTPGPLLQNGHGLLGYKTEGQDGYLASIADTKNMVAFSVDLVGMAHDDNPIVTDAIVGDIGGFKVAIDRQHQGLVNSLLAMRMMKGRFWKDPQVQFDGHSAIDPTQCFYRGDSQGGIFGTTYMAITTDVTRGLLGEPGAPYSLLLNRSKDFGPFFFLLGTVYQDAQDLQAVLGLVQMMWDRTEPNGYLPYISENMLPGTPHHDILIHDALGDQQVTPLGAHLIARAVKAKTLNTAVRPIWGIEAVASPIASGSGIMEFDFGLPEAPKTDTPPTKGEDPHDAVRVLQPAIDQSDVFFRTGQIVQKCAPTKCDPGGPDTP